MKKNKQYVPKEKIWLSRRKKSNEWCYALARYKDGSIRIVEHLMTEGFSTVGVCCVDYDTGEDKEAPCRLYKGERSMIVADLFLACLMEIDLDEELKSKILDYFVSEEVLSYEKT